jgi:hypothetical protein
MKETSAMVANRCNISANDCADAEEYLNAYLELQEKDKDTGTSEFFTPREGLLIAAIISYCRAFTSSRGSEFSVSQVKVNLESVFNNDALKIEQHKRILDRRNKAIAHADWKYHQTELIEVTDNRGVLRKRPCVIYDEGIDKVLFLEMAKLMRQHFHYEQILLDTGRKKI